MRSSLDVPGRLKMATLEEAAKIAQRLHGLIEHMAATAHKNEPISNYSQQVRRTGAPLVSLLKAQFGMVSDHVTQMMIIAGRTGSDRVRVRALREGVAQLRMQLEVAETRVKENHAVTEEAPNTEGSG
jgi:hypothetical protein